MNADPCTYVIYGSTGNLSRIKLMPALYRLDLARRLPEGTKIIAVGRRPWDLTTWLKELKDMVEQKVKTDFIEEVFSRFSARFIYHRGDLHESEAY
jgi:glucose-6-phosphate 1-dehydrogenase